MGLLIDCQFKDKGWGNSIFPSDFSFPLPVNHILITPPSTAVTQVAFFPICLQDSKVLWGHGQCLVCCLLHPPTHTALTLHLNTWLLDCIRVPLDNKAHDFLVLLLEQGRDQILLSATCLRHGSRVCGEPRLSTTP